HDHLTGLYNRRAMEDEVSRRLEDGQFNTALMLLDLDHFKKVNDTYGHETGDQVPISVNSYFVNNPQNVLGAHAVQSSAFRSDDYTVKANGDLAQQLDQWIDALPTGIYTSMERSVADLERQAVELPEFAKEGSFFLQGKEVWQRLPDLDGEHRAVQWVAPSDKALERMTGMVRLRDSLRRQMKMERSSASDHDIESGRTYLNRLYDDFKGKYGYVNDPTNRRLFLDDTESALLQALEFDYEKAITPAYAQENGMEPRPSRAVKADIFQRRVLFPPGEIEVVHTAKDALLHSLNYRGDVDMAYMQRAYGKDEKAILDELGDLLFVDPVKGLVTADEYLAGDVKTRLAEASKAAELDPSLARNVEALKKVIPVDKLPSEIHASIGASWIGPKHFSEFAKLVSGGSISYSYVKATGQWMEHGKSGVVYTKNNNEYGTPGMGASDILHASMNSRALVVRKPVNRDGKDTYVVDEEQTEAARACSEKIRALWDSWLWADPDRAQELAGIYNERFNRTRERQYDGSHLTLPGMSPLITLLAHQKNGVWRGLQDRNILLDQVVGAGKTFEIVAMVMEMRRLGIAKKPMLAVPNHLTLQWRSDFYKLYPGANILAATPEDFEKDNRERFFSKVVTGNWDAVIIGHSSLKKIPLPLEAEVDVLEEQIRDIGSAIEDMKRSRGDRHVVRDMEKIKVNLEAKIKRMVEKSGEKDKVVDLADLGVDCLAIDEHHEFKNLMYTTQMTRVAGLGNPAGSGKAFDLFVKIRWLKKTFGENAPLITATGTPVSNSLAEMFTMQRYMQYAHLRRQGLHAFDAWAKQYGDVQNVYEVAPSGTGYRLSQRFAKFKNLGSLMGEYRSFADVITLKHLKAQEIAQGRVFPVPQLATGRPINVVVPRSALQEQYFGVPEIERTEEGDIKFEVNLLMPTRIHKDEAGRFVMQQDDNGIQRVGARRYDTAKEAAYMTAMSAITPVMKIDPNSLIGQFERVRELTRATKGKINALSLTSLANKAGLDYRLIDPSAPDDPNSKVNHAVRNL
ncbi:MAG: diguanylate cyclase, partial [Pseudomonadota bacterium]